MEFEKFRGSIPRPTIHFAVFALAVEATSFKLYQKSILATISSGWEAMTSDLVGILVFAPLAGILFVVPITLAAIIFNSVCKFIVSLPFRRFRLLHVLVKFANRKKFVSAEDVRAVAEQTSNYKLLAAYNSRSRRPSATALYPALICVLLSYIVLKSSPENPNILMGVCIGASAGLSCASYKVLLTITYINLIFFGAWQHWLILRLPERFPRSELTISFDEFLAAKRELKPNPFGYARANWLRGNPANRNRNLEE